MDAPTIPPRAEWIPPASEEYQAKHPNWDEPIPTLANVLDAHKWAALKIPVETKFLGEFITPATKTFLIGTTGIGKTMFGYELVGAMASATDLLHWKCERASRWLVIDGEMPTSLIKKRIAEVLARYKIPDGNLLIYSTGRAEELAKLITDLGEMPPLSTEAGHKWVLKVAEELLVEGILFDNLMSLSPGDHREPQVWLDTLPLADALSRKNIAQIWCDHTGWDTSRQYGTNTKAWRFDTAAVMKPLPEDQRENSRTRLHPLVRPAREMSPPHPRQLGRLQARHPPAAPRRLGCGRRGRCQGIVRQGPSVAQGHLRHLPDPRRRRAANRHPRRRKLRKVFSLSRPTPRLVAQVRTDR